MRAHQLREQGIETARLQGNVQGGLASTLAKARVLIGVHGASARDEIEATLARVEQTADRAGVRTYEPLVLLERAQLDRLSGDEGAWLEGTARARDLFSEIGASGHAEHLREELALAGAG